VRISWYSTCARQVSQKIDVFCVCVKKIRKYLMKSFLAPNFAFFQMTQKILVFCRKSLRAYTTSRCKKARLFCWNFWHLEMRLKLIIINQEHMLLGAKAPCPFLNSLHDLLPASTNKCNSKFCILCSSQTILSLTNFMDIDSHIYNTKLIFQDASSNVVL
jgi:hypothetical protein